MGAISSRAEQASAAPLRALDADWAAICRRIVAAQARIFEEVRGIEARTVYEGVGEGGDHTLVIDRRCEDEVFAELEALAAAGASFVAVSEERGEVSFGGGGEVRVVIDPIDGSLNARRTIPSHSLSLAVADGPSAADVVFGYVYDFGAGEEFAARRGEGATLDGAPVAVDESPKGLEVVGIEAAKPEWAAPVIAAMAGDVYRFRGIGSLAINLAYVGSGRLDGMLSLRDTRSVDIAAGQLIVREAGGHVTFGDLGLEGAGLGLEERYPVLAAASAEGLAKLEAALRAGGRL
jgi:myo-inositol-1(or 4)-monophosphatase